MVSELKAVRPSREGMGLSYSVVINEVSGGEIANILRGYILVKDEKIRFTGIAYGRYGGQNVALKFSPVSKKRVKEIFGNPSTFEEDLQMKLIAGDFEVQPRTEKKQ